MTEDTFLTIGEVAQILRCNKAAVYERIQAGLIPAFRDIARGAGPYLIRKSDLERHIDAHMTSMTAKEPPNA